MNCASLQDILIGTRKSPQMKVPRPVELDWPSCCKLVSEIHTATFIAHLLYHNLSAIPALTSPRHLFPQMQTTDAGNLKI